MCLFNLADIAAWFLAVSVATEQFVIILIPVDNPTFILGAFSFLYGILN